MGDLLDLRYHDYYTRPNVTPHTVCHLQNMESENKNFTSITAGAENCTNLLISRKIVQSGVTDNGLDTYFYVEDANTQQWHNLFVNPDVLSKNEVSAREDYLRHVRPYAMKNLDPL